MNAIQRRGLVLALGLIGLGLVLGLGGPSRGDEKAGSGKSAVKLVTVKYADLMKAIAADKKAKLTIVDAWATWCGPCKDNFPHVVEMHKKYASQGLAVISLSLDDHDKPKKVAEATEFLQGQKATCANYILEESTDDAFEKLNITAIPAVFVFGPDGKEIKRFTGEDPNNQFTYDQVEAFVKEQLEGKSAKK